MFLGNAPGGNAIGGHTGSMTLLGRQAGLPEVINGVLTTIGLRRRQVLDDVAGAIDATLHPARRSGAAGLVYREVVPDMSNAEQ